MYKMLNFENQRREFSIQNSNTCSEKKNKNCKFEVNEILNSTLQKEQEKSVQIPTSVKLAEKCPYFVSLNNKYPGFRNTPSELPTVKLNEKFSFKKLFVLLRCVFVTTDRVIVKTQNQKFIVFRQGGCYYIYNGCTCNINSFRYMDLSCGVAGLISAPELDDVVRCIKYFCKGKVIVKERQKTREEIIEEILSTYS